MAQQQFIAHAGDAPEDKPVMSGVKRAFVTGATGFTGGRLAYTLLEKGYAVKALVRDPEAPAARGLASAGVELLRGDAADPEVYEKGVAGCSHAFHIAAVYRTANHPDEYYYAVNRDSVTHLLQAAEAAGVERVVHCSTCGVHGDVAEIPATEETAFNPGDVYQRSKLAGEDIARKAMADGAPVSVVRPTGIYGPGDLRFLKLFKTIDNGAFRMFGSGDIAYHMTYVDDMVAGLILAGEHPAAIGETFLIGSEDYTSLNEMVRMIAETLGVRPPRGRLPVAPLMAAATLVEFACKPLGLDPPLHRRRVSFFTKARAFSIEKAKRLIGFTPQTPLAEGLARTASWYRAEGHLRPARSAA